MASFNIANNQTYKWTSTNGSYLEESPRIYAKTYKPLNNDIFKSVESWIAVAGSSFSGGGFEEFYDNLHPGAAMIDMWTFPYFEDDVRSFSNEWGNNRVDSTSPKVQGYLSQSVESTLGDTVARGSAAVSEGVGIIKNLFGEGSVANSLLLEPPKFYQYGPSDSDVVIDFPLSNTVDGSDIDKNYNLVKKLIEDNRFERVTGVLTNSPLLWDVTIPGYRYIRWASCDVSVSLVGNRRYINKKLIPEGYRIKLTFKSLYTEPKNFMGAKFIEQ
jgi:hypothetical protein